MTQTIDAAADTYSDQNLPLPSNGEPNTIDSILPAFQQLLDGVRYVRDALFDAAAASGGARKLWTFASTAALKAETAQADGHLAFVRDTGIYRFHAAGAEGESLPWIVAPTVGGGRWKHVLLGLLDVAAGLPKLDGDAKVPLARVHNAIVNSGGIHPGSALLGPLTSSYQDVPNSTLLLDPNVDPATGDIVEAEMIGEATWESSTVRAQVLVGASETAYGGPSVVAAAGEFVPYAMVVRHTVVPGDVGADLLLKVQARQDAPGTAGTFRVRALRARLIRP